MSKLKDPTSIIGWINEIVKLVSDHGVWKICKGALTIAFVGIILNVVFNPTGLLDRVERILAKKETQNMEYRRVASSAIRSELKTAVSELDATRACVMEFHNGVSNLSSLGFLYASMTYEETRDGVSRVSRVYGDVSLSLFNITDIMYSQGYWFGCVDDLAKIDAGLAQSIAGSGTEWIAALLLESSKPLGFLILSFDSHPEDEQKMGREIRRLGVSIASKLDYVPG